MFFQVLPESVFQPVERPHCYRRRACPQSLAFPSPMYHILSPVESREQNCNRLWDAWNQRQTHCPVLNRNSSQTTKKKQENVLAKLDFHEFSPEEIKVKVVDNSVVVHGRHEDDSSFFEVRRSVPLPKRLSSPDVICRYVDGHVIVELPPLKARCEQMVKDKSFDDKSVQDNNEDDRKHKEGKCSEEERESYEAFVKNLTNLQEMFFGLPFFVQHQQNETSEKTSENEDGNDKTSKMEGEEKKTEEVNAKAKDEHANAIEVKAEADDTREKENHSESEEQTQILVESDNSENSDDFVHVNTESSDLDEPTDQEINKRDTLLTVHSAEVAQPLENFKVELDLSNFKPDDIRVVVSDRQVMVSGEREIKGDNYFETEKWSRCIKLPEGVDASKLSSIVDKDGKMTIQAPYHKEKGEATQDIQVE